MPARRLLMRKIREVLRLKHEHGLSHRAIAQACAMGVGTVTLYLRRTAQSGLGWPLPAELDDAALEARLFRRPAPVRDRVRVRPDCAYVHRELKRDGVTLQLLWEEHASGPSERLPLHAVLRVLPADRSSGCGRRCDRSTAPARRPSSTSRASGRAWSTGARASCGRSSCSSRCSAPVASPTPRRPETQQLPDWVDAHIRMVEYFGGATTIVDPRPVEERHHPTLPLRGRRQPHLRGPGRPLRRGRHPGAAEKAPGQGCG